MIETTAAPVIPDDFVSLALDHCKVDAGEEESAYEDLVDMYLAAATGRIEAASGRALFKRTMKFTADAFGAGLELPVFPVISITSVAYLDTAGDTQTLPSLSYKLLNRIDRPLLVPAPGYSWPETWDFPGSITVVFDAGYGPDSDDVPAALRMAVLQTTADFMRFGGNVATTSLMPLPDDAKRACKSFRRDWF